jgi:hypothetical protein
MRITSAGDVGIGTTSPVNNSGYTTLSLNNATTGGVVQLLNNNTTVGQLYNDTNTVHLVSSGTNTLKLEAQGAGAIAALTNTVERMRITSAGGISFGSSGTAYGTSGQVLQSNGNAAPTWVSASTGTVTSVSFTGGIISVATATTTPAFTVAGTSGGIPYFSSGTTWASSAALAASAIVLGGGAGTAPATTTTGTGVVTAIGSAVNTAGGLTTIDGTATLTNKRVTPRVAAISPNTATPLSAGYSTDSYDMIVITGQNTNITSMTTGLSGTPTNGQKLWVAITGTLTSVTWGASFVSSGTVTLPTAWTASTRKDIGFVWNVAANAWMCVAVA